MRRRLGGEAEQWQVRACGGGIGRQENVRNRHVEHGDGTRICKGSLRFTMMAKSRPRMTRSARICSVWQRVASLWCGIRFLSLTKKRAPQSRPRDERRSGTVSIRVIRGLLLLVTELQTANDANLLRVVMSGVSTVRNSIFVFEKKTSTTIDATRRLTP